MTGELGTTRMFVSGCAVVALTLAACVPACSKSDSRGAPARNRAETSEAGDPSLLRGNGEGWTRAEWLRAVDGFVANPRTMPRLDDPESRPAFEKLVSTDAWLDQDWRIFEGNGNPEMLRFFPSIKSLTRILMSQNAVDELIALGLYNLDVNEAFIESGTEFIARLPEQDPTKNNRQEGLDRVRLGAAISLCGLLYLVIDASDEYRAKAFERLTDPAEYSFHSRNGLQLILATLDERLLESGPAAFQKKYAQVRSVVAAEYEKRGESNASTRVTYQGLGPPGLDSSKLRTVVSTTGRFQVELGPGALASRVEVRRADGSVAVRHRIERQQGDTRFEAVCLDGETADAMADQFMKMGLSPEESRHSGHWLAANRAGTIVRMRVRSIGGRGCLASVEGPIGQVPPARIQSFLLSLRAAS